MNAKAIVSAAGVDKSSGNQKLTFEFTHDLNLIHQHILLYAHELRSIHVPDMVEEEYVRSSIIEVKSVLLDNESTFFLIAHTGGRCIGGAWVSVSTPKKPTRLPLEIGDYRLVEHFPELRKSGLSYCLVSKFVLLPEFRTNNVKHQMMLRLRRKIAELGVDVVFACSPKANARLYRRICAEMGLERVKIHYGIPVPRFSLFEKVTIHIQSVVVDKTISTKMLDERVWRHEMASSAA